MESTPVRKSELPILYSFRRCPYAMRARLALLVSQITVEIREVVLREKPLEFLNASVSATVPCLITQSGTIDESLDIMIWALKTHDPENWLDVPSHGYRLIGEFDGPFKEALDKTKYSSRYPDLKSEESKKIAASFLHNLETQLNEGYISSKQPTLVDFALLPFIRQFANIDYAWFSGQPWPKLNTWLSKFLTSAAFNNIQIKYPKWKKNDPISFFPTR